MKESLVCKLGASLAPFSAFLRLKKTYQSSEMVPGAPREGSRRGHESGHTYRQELLCILLRQLRLDLLHEHVI